MKQTEREWFRNVSWDTVVSLNHSFCESQQTPPQLRDAAYCQAEQLWKQSASRRLSLPEAVDVCRRCYDLGPFVFNNGNTFAASARKLMEDWLQLLPPVEAQIARTTVGHYVVGQVTRRELIEVLSHFASRWQINGAEHSLATPPLRELRPQAQAPVS